MKNSEKTSYKAGNGLKLKDGERSVPVPLELECETKQSVISCTNKYSSTDSTVSYGITAKSNQGAAVRGLCNKGIGIYGNAGKCGVEGKGPNSENHGQLGTQECGVYGEYRNKTSGKLASANYGVYGKSRKDGTGVAGHNETGKNHGYLGTKDHGVHGFCDTTNVKGSLGTGKVGVLGSIPSELARAGAVCGQVAETNTYAFLATTDSNKKGTGVYCQGTRYGIYARKTYGVEPGSFSKAGYFDGDVDIKGTLTKSKATLKIDHPLDPENKYLNHSSVDSSEMKNIYDGTAVLNKKGEAIVRLPKWFEALNCDFRYQLTPIGNPGPCLHISEEISNCRFKIAGGSANLKVSWQVTGKRNDPYAKKNSLIVEEKKSKKEQGYYLHPEVYGFSEKKNINQLVLNPADMK
ncbi:hypothetical protein ACFL40_06045 [candidate division KSB1 bacterium]